MTVKSKAKFCVAYETWNQEDAEFGDTDDRGFLLEDSSVDDRDFMDYINRLDNTEVEVTECSNGSFVVSVKGRYTEDYRTGATTYHTIIIEGLSKKEFDELNEQF